MRLIYTKGLKAGSVYKLNKGYVLNNRVHLTTRVYSISALMTSLILFLVARSMLVLMNNTSEIKRANLAKKKFRVLSIN